MPNVFCESRVKCRTTSSSLLSGSGKSSRSSAAPAAALASVGRVAADSDSRDRAGPSRKSAEYQTRATARGAISASAATSASMSRARREFGRGHRACNRRVRDRSGRGRGRRGCLRSRSAASTSAAGPGTRNDEFVERPARRTRSRNLDQRSRARAQFAPSARDCARRNRCRPVAPIAAR